MEFASFEDDLFDDQKSGKKRSPVQPETYVPKLEYPGWFLDGESKDDDVLERKRMQANYFYWRRDYEKAAQLYGHLFENTTSNLLQLEFIECYARSLMACDRFDEAERTSIDFYNRALNYDQQLQALNLLSDIYWTAGDYKRCAVAVGCLASMMEGGNADIWYRLGHCFLRWTDTHHRESQGGDLIDSKRLFGSDFSPSAQWFRKCLSRAHAIYWSTYATSVGYAKERNENMRHLIEADLKSIYGDDGGNRRTEGKEETGLQEEAGDQQSGGKTDLDKMLEGDLVTVFEAFLNKWLA